MRTDQRNLLITLVVLAVIALVVPAVAWGIGGWGMMGPGMMGGYWSGGQNAPGGTWFPVVAAILGILSMVAFWGAVIVGIVLLVRWLGGPTERRGAAGGETPLDILRRRYAAGEIAQEDYERMRQTLER